MLSQANLIQKIAADLGMLPTHVLSIIRTAPLRYKIFEIPKKSGGMREVAQPAREVKAIQRWIMQELADCLPVHESAAAYREGSSIRKNAEIHANSRFMLKLDFTNFFPSILGNDIYEHLKQHCSEKLDPSAIELITYACCWVRERRPPLRLCIGAPSSPMLSNSIMFEFDSRLASVAAEDGIAYTRYADDITLSCRDRGKVDHYRQVVINLLAELTYPHIEINESKTVYASRAGKRVVTGLVLTPEGKVSIGRERKRLIRAMYHRSLTQELNEKEIQELNGLISFADNIEPGFSERLKKSVRF